MSSKQPSEPIAFLTVFCHELESVMDRRRSQRIESLKRLGAEGDYSRTAVHWAADAADEESALAQRAFRLTYQADRLATLVQEAHQAVAEVKLNPGRLDPDSLKTVLPKIASLVNQLITAIEQRRWPEPQSPTPPPEVTTPQGEAQTTPPPSPLPVPEPPAAAAMPGGDHTLDAVDGSVSHDEAAGNARLRDYYSIALRTLHRMKERVQQTLASPTAVSSATTALKAVRILADIARELLERSAFYRPTEFPEGPPKFPENIHECSRNSQGASKEAARAAKETAALAAKIRTVAAANTAAETVDKARMTADLLQEVLSQSPLSSAEEQAAARAEILEVLATALSAVARATRVSVSMAGVAASTEAPEQALPPIVFKASGDLIRLLRNALPTNSQPPLPDARERMLQTLTAVLDAANFITKGIRDALRQADLTANAAQQSFSPLFNQVRDLIQQIKELFASLAETSPPAAADPASLPTPPSPLAALNQSWGQLERLYRTLKAILKTESPTSRLPTTTEGSLFREAAESLTNKLKALHEQVEPLLKWKNPLVEAGLQPESASSLKEDLEAIKSNFERGVSKAVGLLPLAGERVQSLQAEWKAGIAKDIVTEAVHQLSDRAIEAVRWAWKAEGDAIHAVRAALVFMDGVSGTMSERLSTRTAPPTLPDEQAPPPAAQLESPPPAGPPPEGPDMEQLRLQALDLELVGLSFSGGGIRSATFNLGVLEALGQLQLLHIFDYLSTVSGGGYIGGWLAAWVRREGSLVNVEQQLNPSRVGQSQAERRVKQHEDKPAKDVPPDEANCAYRLWGAPVDDEPEPIRHLRAYSRYLSPRTGVFSADTWTLVAIYLRNLCINLAALLPCALAVVLLSRLLIWCFTLSRDSFDQGARWGFASAFLVSTAILAVWLYQQRTRLQEAAHDPHAHPYGADRLSAGFGDALLYGTLLAGVAIILLIEGRQQALLSFGLVVVVGLGERLCQHFHTRRWTIVGLVILGLGLLGEVLVFWVHGLAWGLAALLTLVLGGIGYLRYRLEIPREQPAHSARPESFSRGATIPGNLLIVLVTLMVVSGTWLFSYDPPAEVRISHLSGQEAETQKLPLRHPRYHWLQNQPFFHDWFGWQKFLFFYTIGTGILSIFAAVMRITRTKSGVWKNRLDVKDLFKRLGVLLLCDVILGAGVGVFLCLVLTLVVWPLGTDSAALVTVGPPVFLVGLVLADYLEMLLLGRLMNESEREWRSRLGAFLMMFAVGWLIFFGTTLYLPRVVQQLERPEHRMAVAAVAGVIWSVISGLGAWAGRWLQQGTSSRRSIPWMRLMASVAPPVFLIGLLAGVSALVFVLTPSEVFINWPQQTSAQATFALDDWLAVACDSDPSAAVTLGVLFLVSLLLILLFNLTIDVNLYSLHILYANRLIRCYLGASRRKHTWRQRGIGPFGEKTSRPFWLWDVGSGGAPTNAEISTIARREPTFTDFDAGDDFPLSLLRTVKPVVQPEGEPPLPDNGYRGPYPLFNTALNLAASSELALQDRKAASFFLSPNYCGSLATGFARIPAGQEGNYLTLGRAVTISGAAVDPNMGGTFQTPQLTALMTVLNTRLGWWIQNPARPNRKWIGKGPGAGYLLLEELFGQTNEKSDYVHLSDGGHFENLGTYELIRRRCRFIVATDAGTDRHAASDNLANLLRLVRIDLGIRIELDTSQLVEGPDARTRWHCAIGLIHYEDVDPKAVAGILVYLRASLTGDEWPDVRQYADSHPDFPCQTTLDQFFDEGQFESYRALGYHIAMEVFADAAEVMNRNAVSPVTMQAEVRSFFSQVRRRWFPAPPEVEQQFLATARHFLGVERNLRKDPFFALRQELYPEVVEQSPLSLLPARGQARSPEMHMLSEMLQTMEIAWYALKLDSYHSHPLNRGWMNIFRRWTSSKTLQAYWPFLRAEYSQDFVRFCENALNMVPTNVHIERLRNKSAFRASLAHLQRMDHEFHQEWATESDRLAWLTTGRYLRDSVAGAANFIDGFPITYPAWMVYLRNGQQTRQDWPCGLVSVAPPYRGAEADLELLAWLRGPYRTLGIGRSCLQPILDDLTNDLDASGALASAFRRFQRPYRLVVYYPNSGVNRAERLQQTLWMNFFFDHGFRSVARTDTVAVAGAITLARELRT